MRVHVRLVGACAVCCAQRSAKFERGDKIDMTNQATELVPSFIWSNLVWLNLVAWKENCNRSKRTAIGAITSSKD